MKIFKKPLVAFILCLALCFASGVLSTRVKLNRQLNSCKTQAAYVQLVDEIKDYSAAFPGNVFIGCSGIKFN